MKISKSRFVLIVVIVFALGAGAGFGAGEFIQGYKAQFTDDQVSISDRYKKIDELYDIVEDQYYEDPDENDIEDGMAKGLFAGLGDKYSGYMTKEEYRSYEDSVMGEFEGIGITFQENKKGERVIISTVKGSPAQKAGLKKNDIILKVDGKEYDNVDKMAAAIKGKGGTKVKLLIKRGDKEKTYEITREQIVMDTVESKMMDGKIGYIKVTSFENHTETDYKEAFSKLESKGMKGFIIDLRDNGGGLIDPAIKIADTLLDKCTITYLEDRAGKKDYYNSDASHTDLPYVILVNGNTASASEILTAAIKDKGEGTIVGTKTYGKGVVQISDELSDGSGYKLTVMQYFSPTGKKINKKGVVPDIKIKGSKEQLNKAVDLLQ